jgi:hypothetical protein
VEARHVTEASERLGIDKEPGSNGNLEPVRGEFYPAGRGLGDGRVSELESVKAS